MTSFWTGADGVLATLYALHTGVKGVAKGMCIRTQKRLFRSYKPTLMNFGDVDSAF